MSNPLAPLADIAARYLGTQEIPRGSNCGPMVDRFKAATDLPSHSDWAWCAAFVSFCVQEFSQKHPDLSKLEPRLAGAWAFEDWARKNGALIFNCFDEVHKPQAGDIVTFTFSHIGIVAQLLEGGVSTIEGNSNDQGSREGYEVCRRVRRLSVCRKFIRLPILGQPV